MSLSIDESNSAQTDKSTIGGLGLLAYGENALDTPPVALEVIWDSHHFGTEALRRVRIEYREAAGLERGRREIEEFRNIAERATGHQIKPTGEAEIFGASRFDCYIV